MDSMGDFFVEFLKEIREMNSLMRQSLDIKKRKEKRKAYRLRRQNYFFKSSKKVFKEESSLKRTKYFFAEKDGNRVSEFRRPEMEKLTRNENMIKTQPLCVVGPKLPDIDIGLSRTPGVFQEVYLTTRDQRDSRISKEVYIATVNDPHKVANSGGRGQFKTRGNKSRGSRGNRGRGRGNRGRGNRGGGKSHLRRDESRKKEETPADIYFREQARAIMAKQQKELLRFKSFRDLEERLEREYQAQEREKERDLQERKRKKGR